MIGDARLATEMANEILGMCVALPAMFTNKSNFYLAKGIFVVGFSFPVVPKGGLFRCSIIQVF